VQGRGLLRLARASWPHPAYAGLGDRPHHPLVLGVAVAAAGGAPGDAATLAALGIVSGPASAAVRLLGLDPIVVTALLARLAGPVAAVAGAADGEDLPATGHPLLDVWAERHAARATTLFTS
jgi:urease accessory protein